VRRRWVALLSVLTVAGAVYLMLFTSLLGVRSVEVVGLRSLDADEVRAVAQVPRHRAMLRVDTGQIADRVAALPGVADAAVSRSWPSTIEIVVTERSPIGYVDTGEEIRLVDGNGVVFRVVSEPPAGLPRLELPRIGPDDPVTRSATAVLAGLPPQLRERVVAVSAETPAGVELELADGKVIRWGDAEQAQRKAKVLAALMSRPGTTYDVSSPELPTVS
jgi:cell division protein FtsQ